MRVKKLFFSRIETNDRLHEMQTNGEEGVQDPKYIVDVIDGGSLPVQKPRTMAQLHHVRQADDVQDFCCSFSPSISRKMNAAMAVGRLGPRLWCRRRLGAEELCTVLCKRLSEIRSYSRNLFDNIAVARGRACVDRQANEHEQVAN